MDQAVTEIVSMIAKKREQITNKEIEKKEILNEQRDQLIKQILSMRDRIQNLIAIGNALRENKFLFKENPYCFSKDSRLSKYGYDGEVVAEGFYHHVGFMVTEGIATRDNVPIGWVGIRMGGACGAYDFYTDGDEVVSFSPEYKRHQPVPVSHLKQFIKEFPEFESAIYAWINDTMKQ